MKNLLVLCFTILLADADKNCSTECSTTRPSAIVCGIDGVTYSSECELCTNRVDIYAHGPCPDDANSKSSTMIRNTRTASQYASSGMQHDEAEPVDCRTFALDASTDRPYRPKCDEIDDRLYEVVQCVHNGAYCFCVDRVTGMTVLGTTTTDGRQPDCARGEHARMADVLGQAVGIQDCPPQKQSRFIHRLQALLIGRLLLLPAMRVNSSDNHLRLAAIYAMNSIDNDQNKHLTRREWRGYRLQLMQWAGVKKCVRNFFTFCDANDDHRLNETEWISCKIFFKPRKS